MRFHAGLRVALAIIMVAVIIVVFSCQELPTPEEAVLARFPSLVQRAPEIRVLAMSGVQSLKVGVDGPFALQNERGRAIPHRNERLDEVEVRADKGGFIFGPEPLDTRILLLTPEKPGTLIVNGARWKGSLSLVRSQTPLRFHVVNVVNIEAYLCGVLAAETPYTEWPMEALRAQSVASRTYAIYETLVARKEGKPFDVRGDQFGQVYAHGSADSPIITRAVNSTRGVVLLYQGRIFPTYFSAVCGGHTESASNVFRQKFLTPLRGYPCPFCAKGGSKFDKWEKAFSTETIRKALEPVVRKEFARAIGPVRRVEAVELGVSGRVIKVRIVNALEPVFMNANTFRLALGSRELPSTFFTVETTAQNRITFKGKGWGHGVGMCQFGAAKMAEGGATCYEILGYYYAGSEPARLDYAVKGKNE